MCIIVGPLLCVCIYMMKVFKLFLRTHHHTRLCDYNIFNVILVTLGSYIDLNLGSGVDIISQQVVWFKVWPTSVRFPTRRPEEPLKPKHDAVCCWWGFECIMCGGGWRFLRSSPFGSPCATAAVYIYMYMDEPAASVALLFYTAAA